MAISCDIEFIQGATINARGFALAGVIGTAVTVGNWDNSGPITNWKFEVLDVSAPGSSITPGVKQNGATPTWAFTPDASGGMYFIQETVTDGSGNVAVNQMCFIVLNTSFRARIAEGAAARHVNLGASDRGWAKFEDAYKAAYDSLEALYTAGTLRGTTFGAGGALIVGQGLYATGVAAAAWGALNLGLAAAVTGTLPAGNQAPQVLSGDATGNTGAVVVGRINGTSVPSTPAANQIPVATSGTTAVWQQLANAQVSNTAAIAGSKISPDFVAQTIATTGFVSTPRIDRAGAGNLLIGDTNATGVFLGSSTANTTVVGNLTVNGTTTTVHSTVVDVDARILHANFSTGIHPVPSAITGLAIERGSADGVTPRDVAGLFWDESNSRFVAALNTAGDDTTLGGDLAFKALGLTLSGLGTGLVATNSSGVFSSGVLNLGGALVSGTLPAGNQAPQTISGDGSGTTATLQVTALLGRLLSTTAPTDGQSLVWVAGTSRWTPTTVSGGGGGGPDYDRTGAGPVTLAGTNATSCVIGQSSFLTTIQGGLQTTGHCAFGAAPAAAGTFRFTNGSSSYIHALTGATFDFRQWEFNASSQYFIGDQTSDVLLYVQCYGGVIISDRFATNAIYLGFTYMNFEPSADFTIQHKAGGGHSLILKGQDGSGGAVRLVGGSSSGSSPIGPVSIESDIALGRVVKAMGDANVTLSVAESAANVIVVTGLNTGVRNILSKTLPTAGNAKLVRNQCTGVGVTFQFASGASTATIPPGTSVWVNGDGTNAEM